MGPLDRRRRILVNRAEVLTDAALREAAAALGLRIDAKPRLADAVEIDRSGLSDDAYRYAQRAHLDWVVSDLATTRAEFAVEFDGPSHDTPDARRRDALKDEVCARLGLPLLRVGEAVLRPAAERTVLGIMLDAWTAWRGFMAAQDAGEVAWDEPYNPLGFLLFDESGEIEIPLDFAQHVKRRIVRLWRSGVLPDPDAGTAIRYPSGTGRDDAEAYAWVATGDGRWVIGHTRIRTYSFPAFEPYELVEGLAYLNLGDRIDRWREGDEAIPVSREEARRILPKVGRESGWMGSMNRGPD